MNLALVQLNDRVDQSQSEAGAAPFSGRIAAIKSLKDMRLSLGRNTRTIVFHFQNSNCILLPKSDLYTAATGCVFDRILDQIENETKE
jgi:hypothetical protein